MKVSIQYWQGVRGFGATGSCTMGNWNPSAGRIGYIGIANAFMLFKDCGSSIGVKATLSIGCMRCCEISVA